MYNQFILEGMSYRCKLDFLCLLLPVCGYVGIRLYSFVVVIVLWLCSEKEHLEVSGALFYVNY